MHSICYTRRDLLRKFIYSDQFSTFSFIHSSSIQFLLHVKHEVDLDFVRVVEDQQQQQPYRDEFLYVLVVSTFILFKFQFSRRIKDRIYLTYTIFSINYFYT